MELRDSPLSSPDLDVLAILKSIILYDLRLMMSQYTSGSSVPKKRLKLATVHRELGFLNGSLAWLSSSLINVVPGL